MKQNNRNAHLGLHLVNPDETPARPVPNNKDEAEMDRLIGQAVRRYEQLHNAVDRELLAEQQDIDRLGELLPQMQQLREVLARHGVHVRP